MINALDDEEFEVYSSISSAFLLMMDSDTKTLPAVSLNDICRPEHTAQRAVNGQTDQELCEIAYQEFLVADIVESLKASLTQQEDSESPNLMTEFAAVSAIYEEEFDAPLFRLMERRSTKPS